MQYIKIVNWQKYQHYKNRRPPWIKLYSKLLRKYEFICLQDDSKLLLIFLWLLASTVEEDDPVIPADLDYLKQQLPIKAKIDLQPLIEAGFIEVLAICKQNDSNLPQTEAPYTETETETEEKRKEKNKSRASPFTYTSEFEIFWQEYPKKTGKGAAFTSWQKIKPDAEFQVKILAAVKTQTNCDQWRRDNGQFIPHPATWLNQRRWDDVLPETFAEKLTRIQEAQDDKRTAKTIC